MVFFVFTIVDRFTEVHSEASSVLSFDLNMETWMTWKEMSADDQQTGDNLKAQLRT